MREPGSDVYIIQRDEYGVARSVIVRMFLAQVEDAVIVSDFINNACSSSEDGETLDEILWYHIDEAHVHIDSMENDDVDLFIFPARDCYDNEVDAYNNFMDSLVEKEVLTTISTTNNCADTDPKVLHIVAVKHKPGQEKNYWFEVPEKLVPLIHNGTAVLCDTRRGQQPGVVQTGVYSGDGINKLIERDGARLPLRKIIAVRKEIPMRDIKIASYLETRYPSKDKMIQRLKEFYDYRAFCTRVAVDSAGWLIDGYSAYLIAKMFGLTSIPIWIHSVKEM